MENRFFNRNLAGGAMLDIGVYALSLSGGLWIRKPDQLLSQMKAAPTGVDEQAGLLLSNKEGQMATVMLSMHSKQPKRGMVSCEKGYIEVMEYPKSLGGEDRGCGNRRDTGDKRGHMRMHWLMSFLIWRRPLPEMFLYASGLYEGCNGS